MMFSSSGSVSSWEDCKFHSMILPFFSFSCFNNINSQDFLSAFMLNMNSGLL